VSNAGVSSMNRFVDLGDAEIDLNFAVNAKGPLVCGQVAARRLIAQSAGGVIVNVASMAGKQGRVPYLAHYVASKFAVVGLTQAMAFELAEHRIRVNSVCPGFVATAMQERELAWEAELRGSTPDAIRELWVADTPLARLEEPEDVAGVVAFLLGDDAAFITGEAIAVNGGAFMD
jgi:NAD(P)-dependent dehydrogenase (short-subunit alcohol dehydrogenase family)